MVRLDIDRDSEMSIYKQLVSQIVEAVEKGILRPGDRLPSERELSYIVNIARGTIQKAYKELERKSIVETMRGSGSYISKRQDVVARDSKTEAIRRIDELLNTLSELGLSFREIRAFIDIRMTERENQEYKVRIAAIDCNPEALEIFKVQIAYMKNIEFRMFVIDELIKYPRSNRVFEDYDIIITTPTHYTQISGILFSLQNRIFKIAVSPARDTIIKIATIQESSKIGIITKSMNFKNIIIEHLESLKIDRKNVEHVFEMDTEAIRRFLKEKNVIIIPQCFSLQEKVFGKELLEFFNAKGKIIEFKYQIERGSLIYIEEQIGEVLHRR